MYIKTEDLTRQLDYGMDTFRHYIGTNIRLKQKMKSPFLRNGKQEEDPSFSIYFNTDKNAYYFKDHGLDKTGNHYQFVMDYFGIDFRGAVKKIKQDLLGIVSDGDYPSVPMRPVFYEKPEIKSVRTEIIPGYRQWTESDLKIFEPAMISRSTLDLFHVNPATHYDLKKENKTIRITEKSGEPIFIIDFPSGRKKAYRPIGDPRFKWTSSLIAEEDFFGFDLIPKECDDLFLIGGNRDTMSFFENIGYPCGALSSESSNIPDSLLQLLRAIAKNVWVLYDNDKQGWRKADKFHEEYGFKPLNHLYRRFKGTNEDGSANDFCDMATTGRSEAVRDFHAMLQREIGAI